MSKFISLILTIVVFAGPAWASSNSVRLSEENGYRYIRSNGIPDHEPGQFPNAGNPNHISAQDYTFRVPLSPERAVTTTPLGHDLFGVSSNGVPFDPGAAEYWNDEPSSGWNYEALSGMIDLGLDHSHAHVQPNGAYHYHGIPSASVRIDASMQFIGYAADGFPIYYEKSARSSYRLKKGERPSGPRGRYDGSFVQDYEYVVGEGDLDECNGKTGPTPEYSGGIYYYCLTEGFPFVPRYFRGEPDASFKKKHSNTASSGGRPTGGRAGRRPQREGGPPSEAVEACKGRRAGDDCSFNAPHGMVRGRCEDVPEGFTACVPR